MKIIRKKVRLLKVDNKKWSKRFSTIFWWFFGILPLLVIVIQFIGYHLTFNSGISSSTDLADYHNNVIGNFINIFDTNMINFTNWIPTTFSDSFVDIFNTIGISSSGLALFVAWLFVSFLIHLIFDLFVWLIRFFHQLLERVNCD